jgi:fructokinase
MMMLVGGIEAGGTKFVCAVGSGPESLQARIELPTTSPDETIGRVLEFFRAQAANRRLSGIGIASFGPIDVHRASPHFGRITSTPKPGWQNVDLAGPVSRALNLPVVFETDVNAAAVGEQRWGAAQGLDTFLYVTVGTGIGGGGMVEGRLMHGVLHPEMGHLRIPHDWQADPFPGSCPFHGDCWEGLAAGPAIEARWGSRGERLPPDDRAWHLEAQYVALGVTNLVCTLAPQRVILGGGVMQQAGLLPLIRKTTLKLLNNYIRVGEITDHIDDYIVLPRLGANAGVLGAMALASDAAAAAEVAR